MMKKISLWLLVLSASLTITAGAWAATEEVISVTAQIPEASPNMSITILKFTDGNPDNNPWTNSAEEKWMNFDTLTYIMNGKNAGFFYSPAAFCVVIFTDPFGKPYEIKSSSSGLTSPSGVSIPKNSFAFTPVYSSDDLWVWEGGSAKQGSMPSGARLGSPNSAVGQNLLIYSSESGIGSARILQVYYSLPPYGIGGTSPFGGFAPIPLTQPPDTYTGTITLTMAVK
ncbi:MAG: hypothetical protein PHQ57_04800 [Candidatus Omnitrophica bacterium]|nr:hypothetical protein [Candidatus Omnitrophota bacterium]